MFGGHILAHSRVLIEETSPLGLTVGHMKSISSGIFDLAASGTLSPSSRGRGRAAKSGKYSIEA